MVLHAQMAVLHQSLRGPVGGPVLTYILQNLDQVEQDSVVGQQSEDGVRVFDVASQVQGHSYEQVSQLFHLRTLQRTRVLQQHVQFVVYDEAEQVVLLAETGDQVNLFFIGCQVQQDSGSSIEHVDLLNQWLSLDVITHLFVLVLGCFEAECDSSHHLLDVFMEKLESLLSNTDELNGLDDL